MKKLIILDGSTQEVHIYEIPNASTKTTEAIESWISTSTQHKVNESNWMILPQTFQFTFH